MGSPRRSVSAYQNRFLVRVMGSRSRYAAREKRLIDGVDVSPVAIGLPKMLEEPISNCLICILLSRKQKGRDGGICVAGHCLEITHAVMQH